MSEGGVIYTATDATPKTTPEQGMVRQVLAYNPHLMLVRHQFAKGWIGARHSHPHHQLVYVTRGHIRFEAQGKTWELRAGDSVAVDGGSIRRLRWRTQRRWTFLPLAVRTTRKVQPRPRVCRAAGRMAKTMKMRWIAAVAAAAFTCSLHSYAQDAPPNGEIDGIAHIAYRVSNLNNELAFLKKLGYEESFAMTHAGKTTEVFVKVNDRQFLEIYPRTSPNQPLGWMHVCYESADLNALHNELVASGLHPSRVEKAGAGNLIFALRDPDGRTTEFTQYMPGSLHTLDRGKHLGATRVSDTLLGFDLPVANVSAAGSFYDKLGFDVAETDDGLRMTAPGNPNMRIEVRAAHAGAKAETLFLISDARKATEDLHYEGVNARRMKKIVFVPDPDGNLLVFLQAQPE